MSLEHNPSKPVIAVVGGHWGDEGKGKLVDFISQDAKVAVRANGGKNAGHTVVVDGKELRFHQVPSAITNPDVLCIMADGVAFDPKAGIEELDGLETDGISLDNLFISKRASVVLPFHVELDKQLEDAKKRRAGKPIGSTGSGMEPVYTDNTARRGVRAGSLLDKDTFMSEYEHSRCENLKRLPSGAGIPEVFRKEKGEEYFEKWSKRYKDMITNTHRMIHDAIERGDKTILEGAQGAMLSLRHGAYPMVTSSEATFPGLCVGAGIPPNKVDRVYGVFKPAASKVGGGFFPTRMEPQLEDELRVIGKEYGTTTGRDRMIGWFDAVSGGFSYELNGYTDIGVMKLDWLTGLEEIRICRAYKFRGEKITEFPSSDRELGECEPIYTEEDIYPGWKQDISGVTNFEDLPREAQNFLCQGIMSTFPGARLSFVGTGQSRNNLIVL